MCLQVEAGLNLPKRKHGCFADSCDSTVDPNPDWGVITKPPQGGDIPIAPYGYISASKMLPLWSHHIRNLPRLKWNMRTQTCNKSYQVMPVSLLRKGAWVHPDFRDASILWHINPSPRLQRLSVVEKKLQRSSVVALWRFEKATRRPVGSYTAQQTGLYYHIAMHWGDYAKYFYSGKYHTTGLKLELTCSFQGHIIDFSFPCSLGGSSDFQIHESRVNSGETNLGQKFLYLISCWKFIYNHQCAISHNSCNHKKE